LTVKNVSADQLAALENSPVFDAVMQRPRKTMKVQGALGIDVSNWPAIQVIPELPAAKAGLQNGDVIVSVNGRDVSGITTPADALALLRGPAGETLTVRVGRDEQVLDFSVERVPLSK
jgi:C-terminal processing protease CtpA/Prc